MSTSFLLTQDFVVLNAEKKASIEPADAGVYQRLDDNYAGFKGCELISCYEFAEDWSGWEMHPHGDETIVLLSGAVTLILQQQEGEQSVFLTQSGQAVVVPQQVWHTAKTTVASKLLFITPGEGTEHKPL
ncbi:MAG: cupin [Gammaproteobacteria bacterium]|nr:cupin [Gammaproteobacteria bacterium]